VIPTQIPLMKRPHISIAIPLQPAWRDVPRSQKRQAKKMEFRRPSLLEAGPAMTLILLIQIRSCRKLLTSQESFVY